MLDEHLLTTETFRRISWHTSSSRYWGKFHIWEAWPQTLCLRVIDLFSNVDISPKRLACSYPEFHLPSRCIRVLWDRGGHVYYYAKQYLEKLSTRRPHYARSPLPMPSLAQPPPIFHVPFAWWASTWELHINWKEAKKSRSTIAWRNLLLGNSRPRNSFITLHRQ